jgi:hypothetical protein
MFGNASIGSSRKGIDINGCDEIGWLPLIQQLAELFGRGAAKCGFPTLRTNRRRNRFYEYRLAP